MIKPWKTIKSELAFNNKWFKLKNDTVELPNGKIMDDYFYADGGQVSMIFPVTSEGKVLMVRQYKHGVKEILKEFPAGYFDPKLETSEMAAKRELLEETGYLAESLIPLSTLRNSPTKNTLLVHLFLAKDVKRVGEQQLDQAENIEIIELSIPELLDQITNGEITASDTIALVFIALKYLRKLDLKD
jgi:8-oxo-dGTP pyrophosphatase MutT (NUDIX family)